MNYIHYWQCKYNKVGHNIYLLDSVVRYIHRSSGNKLICLPFIMSANWRWIMFHETTDKVRETFNDRCCHGKLISCRIPYSRKVWRSDSFQVFGKRKFGK